MKQFKSGQYISQGYYKSFQPTSLFAKIPTFLFAKKPALLFADYKSVETIYKLTPDTLIISNKSSSISSFSGRKDKYIKID